MDRKDPSSPRCAKAWTHCRAGFLTCRRGQVIAPKYWSYPVVVYLRSGGSCQVQSEGIKR